MLNALIESAGGPQGLAALAVLTFCVGLLYGYVGFGAAMMFMPLASLVIPPETAVLVVGFFGLSSAFVVLPRALRACDRPALLWMLIPALLAMPLGSAVLRVLPEAPLRLAMCLIIGLTLIALIAGFRLRAPPKPPVLSGIGTASGLLGGSTGLVGPVIVVFSLAGRDGAARIRANMIAFLTTLGIALMPSLWINGLITKPGLILAIGLGVLYAIGVRLGARLFDPERERLFRWIAYAVIGIAAVAGLPIRV